MVVGLPFWSHVWVAPYWCG